MSAPCLAKKEERDEDAVLFKERALPISGISFQSSYF